MFSYVADGTDIKPPPKATVNVSSLTSPSETNIGEKPDVSELRYEVMFFLDAPESKIDQFKLEWQDIGDSIVVVGGDGLYNCHIHSNDIGESIEAGIRAGRPYQIRVTDLQDELFHIEDHIEVEGAARSSFRTPLLTILHHRCSWEKAFNKFLRQWASTQLLLEGNQ